jgi:hypothetical protein
MKWWEVLLSQTKFLKEEVLKIFHKPACLLVMLRTYCSRWKFILSSLCWVCKKHAGQLNVALYCNTNKDLNAYFCETPHAAVQGFEDMIGQRGYKKLQPLCVEPRAECETFSYYVWQWLLCYTSVRLSSIKNESKNLIPTISRNFFLTWREVLDQM